MVDIFQYFPKIFNDLTTTQKILVGVIGVISISIALLMFAKAYPGKVKFLDGIVDKIFPPETVDLPLLEETKTKGCKDEDALNYDEDAEEGDDTLCKYPEPELTYIGSGGCVGDNQSIPEEFCDADPECTTIGRQSNGCWQKLSGETPSEDQLSYYQAGLFKKTESGYVSITA